MTYLGIDYGSKHIGLALGDDDVNIASPLSILQNTGLSTFIDQLTTIMTQEQIEAIVVGVPTLATDHTEQLEEVQEFVEELRNHFMVPVETYDESFSSQEATRLLRDVGEKSDHAVAAMLILQGFFDHKGLV